MEISNLSAAIESLLFAADRPVTVERLCEVFGEEGPTREDIRIALEELTDRYQREDHGIELRTSQGGFQFTTKVEHGPLVRKFLESKPFRLGRSAMETLSIIAYRQPVTRAEIDQIRGIDSSHLVRTLIEKGVVKMGGKADAPGRPVQYTTTQKFLDLVGLESTKDLPPLSELKELQGDQPAKEKNDIETGLDRFIDTSELLENRQEELEQGLSEVDSIIESAGDPKRAIYESKEEAETAEENALALQGFLNFAKGKRWPKPVAKATESIPIDEEKPDDSSLPDGEEIEISDVLEINDLATSAAMGATDESAGPARDVLQPSADDAVDAMDDEIADDEGFPDIEDEVPTNLDEKQFN